MMKSKLTNLDPRLRKLAQTSHHAVTTINFGQISCHLLD